MVSGLSIWLGSKRIRNNNTSFKSQIWEYQHGSYEKLLPEPKFAKNRPMIKNPYKHKFSAKIFHRFQRNHFQKNHFFHKETWKGNVKHSSIMEHLIESNIMLGLLSQFRKIIVHKSSQLKLWSDSKNACEGANFQKSCITSNFSS